MAKERQIRKCQPGQRIIAKVKFANSFVAYETEIQGIVVGRDNNPYDITIVIEKAISVKSSVSQVRIHQTDQVVDVPNYDCKYIETLTQAECLTHHHPRVRALAHREQLKEDT